MSGSQLKQRVGIPVAIIFGTAALIGFLGMWLLNISGATKQPDLPTPATSETASFAPAVTETPSATPTQTVAVTRLPVIVLNGTTTAGLAKKIGDALATENWTIEKVDNYSGAALTVTTVYFPAGSEAAAKELATSAVLGATTAPATATMSQSALTVVLAK